MTNFVLRCHIFFIIIVVACVLCLNLCSILILYCMMIIGCLLLQRQLDQYQFHVDDCWCQSFVLVSVNSRPRSLLSRWQQRVFADSICTQHKKVRSKWVPEQLKHCLYFSSICATFMSVSYVLCYIWECLMTQSNDSVNHYSPACSPFLWQRRPLHSLPASCANLLAPH